MSQKVTVSLEFESAEMAIDYLMYTTSIGRGVTATVVETPSEETSNPAPDTSASESENTSSDEVLVSDAVREFAEQHDIDVTAIEGTGKKGRILKSDVAAAIEQKEIDEADAEGDEDDDDDIDALLGLDDDEDDDDLDDAGYTLDDVREALKSYQIAAKSKLLASGKSEAKAKTSAIEVARKLLKKVGGTEKLAGLGEEKFEAVVNAANTAAAKLT